MLTFINELANRTGREVPLTLSEAGFRFAEFNPEQNRFRLSRPYELVPIPERGTLTIRQAFQPTNPC